MLEKIIRNLDNAGAELGTSWNYPEFDALLDAQRSRFRGIPITLHAPFTEVCCSCESAEHRDMEQRFCRAMRWYRDFKASSIVMHTHERTVTPEKKLLFQEYAMASIDMTARMAREAGVRLTVENVGYAAKGNVLFDQNEFIELFSHLPPDVGALIDVGHAMANGWDIPTVIKSLGKRIKAFHLHNTDGIHDLHRPIFEGGLCYSPEQMENLLYCIRDNSPRAALILEYAPGEHINTELFQNDLKRIRMILK